MTQPKPRPKADAIQAILAAAGVEYTHENSEVVGSSRVEAELSRRAEEAGNDVEYGEERLFAESQPGISSDPAKTRTHYEFHPPEEVMHRQFCTMAQTFGFSSATEFAFAVEGMTQKQRTNTLEKFYMKRREVLMAADLQESRAGVESGYDRTRDLNEDVTEDITLDLAQISPTRVSSHTPIGVEDTETEEDDEL
jgi:hypothetical protein